MTAAALVGSKGMLAERTTFRQLRYSVRSEPTPGSPHLPTHLKLISDDPKKLLKEIEERMENVRSPFRTAEAFIAEEIIDPRDTRKLLCEFANLSAPLREKGKRSFGLRP